MHLFFLGPQYHQVQGQRFEILASVYFPDDSLRCSSFLRHKTYLISPKIFKTNGIHFNKVKYC